MKIKWIIFLQNNIEDVFFFDKSLKSEAEITFAIRSFLREWLSNNLCTSPREVDYILARLRKEKVQCPGHMIPEIRTVITDLNSTVDYMIELYEKHLQVKMDEGFNLLAH